MSDTETKPCPGLGTCCNRPMNDRILFPCDPWTVTTSMSRQVAQLRQDFDHLVKVLKAKWILEPDRPKS
jgi:hypothetical protein